MVVVSVTAMEAVVEVSVTVMEAVAEVSVTVREAEEVSVAAIVMVAVVEVSVTAIVMAAEASVIIGDLLPWRIRDFRPLWRLIRTIWIVENENVGIWNEPNDVEWADLEDITTVVLLEVAAEAFAWMTCREDHVVRWMIYPKDLGLPWTITPRLLARLV